MPPRKDDDSGGLDLDPRYMHRRVLKLEKDVTGLDGRVDTLEQTEQKRQAIAMWKSAIASFVGTLLAAVVSVIAIASWMSGMRK